MQETVYTPESELRRPSALLAAMLEDLLNSRGLAWRLFIRNISARYRQTIIGYCWAVLPPLLTSAIWIFLNTQNIIKIKDTSVPYPLYVLVGTIIWQVFVDSIHAPMRVVKDSATMIAKINFPIEALILAAFFEVLFNLVIQLVLLTVVFFYFKVPVSFSFLGSLLGIMGIIMMGMMAGILLTPISVLYGDVQQGLPIVLQPLFYMTPIVYTVPLTGLGAMLAAFNPINPLMQFTRELMTTGEIVYLQSSLLISVVTGGLCLLGWLIYRIAMPHLVERIAA